MDLHQRIIDELNNSLTSQNVIDLREWAELNKFDYPTVTGIAMSEVVSKKLIMSEPKSVTVTTLSNEAKEILEKGSPEINVYRGIPDDQSVLKSSIIGASEVGITWAVKQGWIKIQKSKEKDVEPTVSRTKFDSEPEDTWKLVLQSYSNGEKVDAEKMKTLKSRKWLTTSTLKTFMVEKGQLFGKNIVLQSTISLEQVKSGEWKNVMLKELNFQAMSAQPKCGHLHPLLKVREAFRQIFLEMGFEEMKTDLFVESSFWNFDSLFQPQQHSAREAHDTFFISNPARALSVPEDLFKRVKDMHEHGGHGSIGWRYDFSDEEPMKNVLRTHTTSVSSRTLFSLAQQPEFTPKKYFSIDRVFRNETLDATHLAEFHQIEGFIADYNISLSHLIGTLKEFYHRIGIKRLKFKPAYNPYTEPSMEVFGYSEERKKWMEIGNSGIFRPEMLLPLGLPEGVGVAAWGLGLERPTMIMYKLSNIKSLVGHKVDLNMVKSNPICHF